MMTKDERILLSSFVFCPSSSSLLALHHAYVRQVAVPLSVVEAIADYELVGNVKTDVGEGHVEEAHARSVEESADTNGSGLPASKQFHDVSEGESCVDYVFHEQDMATFDRL